MVAAGGDSDFGVGDFVDESVLVGDASGPISGEVVFEGFGFADPFVAVAGDVLQEQVDAFEDLAALLLPSGVVLPGVVVSNESLRRSPGEANEPGAA